MKIVYIRATGIYDDSRATKEIKAFLDAHYTVEVIAWDRNGDSDEQCQKVFGNCDIKFHFFTKKLSHGVGLNNIHKLLGWFSWIKRKLQSINNVNVIHVCNLDAGIGVKKYAKKNGWKLVYDIYDYYVDSHNIPSVAVSWIERQEIALINAADVTIICTEERREQIQKATPKKVVVVHNSPDVWETNKVAIEYDYIYCGTMNGGRLISEILDFYPENSDLKLVFAGYGVHTEKAKSLAEKYPNFTYLGKIPYSEVLANEEKAMAISAIYKPDVRNHRLCAPNKFYEALSLSKPIIVCEGTGIDKIVAQNHIGIVIPYNVIEFYSALRKLKSDQNMHEEMGRRARRIYDEEYCWYKMKERLIGAYEQLEEML